MFFVIVRRRLINLCKPLVAFNFYYLNIVCRETAVKYKAVSIHVHYCMSVGVILCACGLVSDKVHVHGNQSAANAKRVKQMK